MEMNRICRQYETKEGITFTQWQDGRVTTHMSKNDQLITIGTIPYVKETDHENYPQYTLFMECVARHAYHLDYRQARIKGLLPPLPPPVIKPKDYRKRKESANEDESET